MAMSDTTRKTIALVVDDNPDSLGMVSMALEQDGMTVLVATDGTSAIELTRRVEPDVILMDAMMPEMDGFETCRRLKFGPNPILTPIVFMTGLTEQEHILKGLQSGGVDYIVKPVNIDEMRARLSTHIVNSRLLQSARDALDRCGRAVLSFDTSGKLLWGSQNALNNLAQAGLALESDPALRDWISICGTQPVSSVPQFEIAGLSLHFVGMTPSLEILVKLIQRRLQSKEDVLVEAFDLTPREAEVLYWLTLGKTNRDISAILSLSARTVNKHLEQVFQKMGVDNRTSAAVLADRKLGAEE